MDIEMFSISFAVTSYQHLCCVCIVDYLIHSSRII